MKLNRAKAATWSGCYDTHWGRLITKDACLHPAKFARGLIERIYDYCLAQGWLQAGDLVGDPFGGVGMGGLAAAYRKLRWLGLELEPRFVGIGADGWDCPGTEQLPVRSEGDGLPAWPVCQGCAAAWKAGEVRPGHHAMGNLERHRGRLEAMGGPQPRLVLGDARAFAERTGLAAVVTSPPFEDREGAMTELKLKSMPGPGRSHYSSPAARAAQMERAEAEVYGQAAGQIGNERGDKYWRAMARVYAQCHLALRPGGLICVVVKDYVKHGEIVPLCATTARLMEASGFVLVERIRAMLVKEERALNLDGTVETTKTERKGFFRRLAEKKGAPAINWEEVIIGKTL